MITFYLEGSDDETDRLSVSATNDLAEPASRLVREIGVQLRGGCPQSWIVSMDWAAFAAVVASFPHIESITVEVNKASEQEEAYKGHVHTHLELLSRERGIKLNVREPGWPLPPQAGPAPAATAEVDAPTPDAIDPSLASRVSAAPPLSQ